MTSALKISRNPKAELMTPYYPAMLNFKGFLYRMIQKEGEEHKQKRKSLPSYRSFILKLTHINF